MTAKGYEGIYYGLGKVRDVRSHVDHLIEKLKAQAAATGTPVPKPVTKLISPAAKQRKRRWIIAGGAVVGVLAAGTAVYFGTRRS